MKATLGTVTEVVVQLELRLGDEWLGVVRYDNTHGRPHKDVMNRSGKQVEGAWLLGTLNEVLTISIDDLTENAECNLSRVSGGRALNDEKDIPAREEDNVRENSEHLGGFLQEVLEDPSILDHIPNEANTELAPIERADPEGKYVAKGRRFAVSTKDHQSASATGTSKQIA